MRWILDESVKKFPILRYLDEQGNTQVFIEQTGGGNMYRAVICQGNDPAWLMSRVQDCLNGIRETVPA